MPRCWPMSCCVDGSPVATSTTCCRTTRWSHFASSPDVHLDGRRDLSRSEAFALARELMFGAGVTGARANRLAHRAVRMWERGRKSEFPSFSAHNHALVVEATYAIEDIERRRKP
jgi:hypothetical protein